MLDPFADWDAAAASGAVEHYDLNQARVDLAALPPDPARAPKNPASLSRFDRDHMDADQLRRFTKYVKPVQMPNGWGPKALDPPPTPCWLWAGGTHDKGYGRFYLGPDPKTRQKVWTYSHRIAFEHWIGWPPLGYIVDHQCNHKLCCNPTHLWPETHDDNLRLADMRRPWKRRNQYSKE
jgi:hypothetical protein